MSGGEQQMLALARTLMTTLEDRENLARVALAAADKVRA